MICLITEKGDAWASTLPRSGSLPKQTRFMYTFLFSILSTEFHGKTIGTEARNGLELCRQVVQTMDDIPENTKFLMGAALSELVGKHHDKVKDLKSLYGFRLPLSDVQQNTRR